MRKGGTRCPQRVEKPCGFPPDLRTFGDYTPIVFGEADPPWKRTLDPSDFVGAKIGLQFFRNDH